MNFYDHPLQVTYKFPASAVLSTAGVAGRFIGPKGKRGRVLACEGLLTTATTDAASTITVGTAAAPADALSIDVPVQAINTGVQADEAKIRAGKDLAPDTVYQVAGGGEATAGAADITLTVGWF